MAFPQVFHNTHTSVNNHDKRYQVQTLVNLGSSHPNDGHRKNYNRHWVNCVSDSDEAITGRNRARANFTRLVTYVKQYISCVTNLKSYFFSSLKNNLPTVLIKHGKIYKSIHIFSNELHLVWWNLISVLCDLSFWNLQRKKYLFDLFLSVT